MLWRYRCSPCATTFSDIWSFLQWTYWCDHGDDFPIQLARGSLPAVAMACGKLGYSLCPGSHAPHEDDPSSSGCNSPDSLRRSSHLGSAMVLPTGTTVVFHDSSCKRLPGQQPSATVPEVLGCSDPSCASCTICSCAKAYCGR